MPFILKKSQFSLSLLIVITVFLNGYWVPSSFRKNHFSLHYDASMPRDSIVIIIPGMHQNYSDPGYDSIGAFYTRRGITPVYAHIDWKAVGLNTLSATALRISTMLKDTFPNTHFFLFGFSFGAALSLKLSQSIQAEQVLLCSMSPIFHEDLNYLPGPVRLLLHCITNYSINGLSYSSSLGTCLHFLYGDHDHFVINKAVVQNRKAAFKCNETTVVKNAEHSISNRQYLEAIRESVLNN
jgi:hypothetical protein